MLIDKEYYFLTGIPRSGSTVIQSLLSQNPNIYATPTSPLMDMLFFAEQAWRKTPQVQAYSDPIQLPNIYKGIINGLNDHIEKPIIVDKHRGWSKNIKGIKSCFPAAKCICTVRDIPSVIASFLSIINKQEGETYLDVEMKQQKKIKTMENKCNYIFHKHLKEALESVQFGLQHNTEHLILIEYDDLMDDPQGVMNQIYDFFNLSHYTHDLSNVINKTPEDDTHWGLQGLHKIRPAIARTSPHPKEIIGGDMYKKYKKMNLEFWRK